MCYNPNMKVVTDEEKIDELLSRGVENIFPSREFLKSKMMKGEKLTLYFGIDPTGTTLHLGHAIPLLKLSKFQELGHQVIMLVGDFTAIIGDPTDKTAVRRKLLREEIMSNCRDYKKQASKFISFSGPNKALLKYNSKWLSKLTFENVLELTSRMTVDQMLKRDMFVRRSEEGKPIYIHEFLYPLMQGVDSVEMDVDGEIGGNDQMFNMLVGRDLMKSVKNKEKFVITTKLLVDSSGKKMGKTENNIISLDQQAEEMFGKVMSWSDNLIISGFEIVTNISLSEISNIKTELSSGKNPRDMKIKLAREIVKMYHGNKKANEAEENFINTFQKREIPEKIEEVIAGDKEVLSEVLVKYKILTSKGEWKRLVLGNAIHDLVSNQTIKDPDSKVENNLTLKIGKKRFIKIKINLKKKK